MTSRELRRFAIVVFALVGLAAGCSHVGYYFQSVDGQMRLLQARQSISAMVADPATPAPLKSKLARVLEIRDFASRELKLPENLSYRGYSDLRRPFVVWNVFAAREFSVEPQQWCFPIAGCVGYRGYFSLADAEAFAQELRREGLDVYVGGVPAYSTLGWFDDPVLSTFIHYPEHELARLIFHELAHQVAYAKGDSEFNESFAVTVELEGMRRWVLAHGGEKTGVERARERRVTFTNLVLKYRNELGALYRMQMPEQEMRARKAAAFAALREEYLALKSQWGGFAGFDRFFTTVNNANLASVGIYHALVPQFQELLTRHDGDLAAFYDEVKRLASLDADARAKALGAGQPPVAPVR